MKGLRKYIAPFAPDQSGAAAVFTELGGMVIILDAGGCAGNICGFDEPRWFESRSAIFSAGLRDMDAILGRDDRLVEKVDKACRRLKVNFIAIIGTPVPSVIGTDYRALKRMIEKKTGLPVVTVDTNGMELYDVGVRKAFTALFETFAKDKNLLIKPEEYCESLVVEKTFESEVSKKSGNYRSDGILGILGATPLDAAFPIKSGRASADDLTDYYIQSESSQSNADENGCQQVFCYGMGAGLAEIRKAGNADHNVVISPAALPAARYLRQTFGTPFTVSYPLATLPGWNEIRDQIAEVNGIGNGEKNRIKNIERNGIKTGKKILIVHQQVLANSLREYILKDYDADITVASWFDMDKEYQSEGDVRIREEDEWIHLIENGGFDCIIGDSLFRAAVPGYAGQWINVDHFAVSGKCR